MFEMDLVIDKVDKSGIRQTWRRQLSRQVRNGLGHARLILFIM